MFLPSTLRNSAISLAIVSLLALAGCGKVETPVESPTVTAPAPTPNPAPKPAVPNSFDEVTAQLDPGGDLYLYLSTAQWLGTLSHKLDRLHDFVLSGSAGATALEPEDTEKIFTIVKDFVHKSGLEDITGIGASSFAVAPGLYRNKMFVHHYADKGAGVLWSIYGKAPHALSGLDLLPADTAAGGFGDFDLAQLVNFLRQEALQSGFPEAQDAIAKWQTQFAGVTGLQLDDVLASLNGSMGLVLTLDASNTITVPIASQAQTIPAPHIAILIAVKNDLVFNQVDKMVGTNPGIIKVDQPDLRMRTMPIPFFPGLNLRPTVAQWNGYLVIATDDKIVNDMIAVQKGGPGFKSTPEYATLSAGLPQQGNSFGVCTQRFADTLGKIQSRIYAAKASGNPSQAAFMRQISKFQNPGHTFAVRVALPNGLLCIAQGSKGSSQLLAPLVIVPAAIGAGIAIPAFTHAQGFHGIHHRTAPPVFSPSGTPPVPPVPPVTPGATP